MRPERGRSRGYAERTGYRPRRTLVRLTPGKTTELESEILSTALMNGAPKTSMNALLRFVCERCPEVEPGNRAIVEKILRILAKQGRIKLPEPTGLGGARKHPTKK